MKTKFVVAMQLRGADSWITMDESKSQTVMRTVLISYREAMVDRKFRLEKHTVEVLDA
jgi:hypothetical protein